MNRRTRGILCALAGGALWGYSGTIGQYLFSHYDISSQWLTCARMLCAGVILLGVGRVRRMFLGAVWKSRTDALRLVLFAVLGLMTVQLTYLQAIYYSNAATATALQYLGQALIMGVTCIRLMRLPTGRERAALVLAVGGVFLMSTRGDVHALALSPQALAWGLGAAVSLMVYTLLPRRLIGIYGSIPVTGFGMLIGGLVLAVGIRAWTQVPKLDGVGWLYVAMIILLGTTAAFTLYLQGVSDVGGVTASLLSCSEPVCAAVIATVWLHTDLVRSDYLAFAMIILMSVLLAVPGRSAPGFHMKKPRVEC